MHTLEVALKKDGRFEYDAIKRTVEGARLVRGMLLTDTKNDQSKTKRKWKTRFVALGNHLTSFYGERIWEELRHFAPSSLTGIRLTLPYEAICGHDGASFRGDVPQAYLGSPLSGPPTYVEVERRYWP